MPRKSDPSKRATTVCPTCGKEFEYLKSWPRKFCSRACNGKANISNIARYKGPTAYLAKCEQCDKEFTVKPAWTDGRFCSRRCWGDWQSIHRCGDANPNKGKRFSRPKWAGEPVYLTCPVCNDQFRVKPKDRERRKTCSKGCYAVYMTGTQTGEKNGNWRGGGLWNGRN